jgi:hypothetical protein
MDDPTPARLWDDFSDERLTGLQKSDLWERKYYRRTVRWHGRIASIEQYVSPEGPDYIHVAVFAELPDASDKLSLTFKVEPSESQHYLGFFRNERVEINVKLAGPGPGCAGQGRLSLQLFDPVVRKAT